MILREDQNRLTFEKIFHYFTIDIENEFEMSAEEKQEKYQKIFWIWAFLFNLFP